MAETKNEKTNAYLYGANVLTQEPIMCNRRDSGSLCGIVCGKPGSGKTVFIKHEIKQTLDRTEDDVFVIDPEMNILANYYDGISKVKRIDFWHEKAYINPMDLVLLPDFSYENPMETNLNNAVEEKADFIIGFLELVFRVNKNFDISQAAIIRNAVVSILKPFVKRLLERKLNYDFATNPTLADLIEKIEKQLPGVIDKDDPYLERFLHRTSIADKKTVAFGLDFLPDDVRPAYYYVIYEYVRNKGKINSKKTNKYTWLYFEEAHEFLNHYCNKRIDDYIKNTFKQHKSNKIISTLITQSIRCLSESAAGQSIIDNSGFMFCLSQTPIDRDFIKQTYSLPDRLLEYTKDKPSGMGILLNGQSWVPVDFDRRHKL